MLTKSIFDSLTDEECSDIKRLLKRRKNRGIETRDDLKPPQVTQTKLAAAILWASGCQWQDNPGFVCAALLMITWIACKSLYMLVT